MTLSRLSPNTWLLLITALALALRLHGLDTQSLWFDEILTVHLAQLSWYNGLIGLLGHGIQLTPLFHGVVKLWLMVGDSDWLLRFPAVFVGVLTIPVVFRFGKTYVNTQAGLLTALVFAVNPYQIWYAQELKLYVLLPLAAAGSMWMFAQLLRKDSLKFWVALILFNAVGYLAHYFMFLVTMVQFFYLLLTFKQTYKLLRKWSLAQIISILFLVPWWLFILYQQHIAIGVGWVPFPRWYEPIFTFLNFNFAFAELTSVVAIAGVIILLVGLIAGCYQTWQLGSTGYLLLLWLFLPFVLVLIVLSFSAVSLYVDRYFLVTSPILALVIVTGLLSLHPNWLKWIMVSVLLLITVWGTWNIYFDRVNFTKEDWRAVAQALDNESAPGDVIITCTDGQKVAYEYYNPHQNIAPEQVFFSGEVTDAVQRGQVAWVVDVHPAVSSHNLAKPDTPKFEKTELAETAAVWEANNRKEIITVPSITAYYYDLSDPTYLPDVVDWHCKN